jgi:outer membrane protein
MKHVKRSALITFLLFCAGGMPTLAQAQGAATDPVVRQAIEIAERGDPAGAFALLAAQEADRAGEPAFDTALGIAANGAGEYPRAIFALQRVLAIQPGNARARAEFGRALFAVGDTRSARTLLEQAKLQGIPVEAAGTIDQFLQAIGRLEAEGQSSWRGYVEAGFGHDSNVNSGPANPNVAVPALGGVVTLTPLGVRSRAAFASVGAGVVGRYVLDPRWSLIGNAQASGRAHSGAGKAFNNDQINLQGGATYRVERHEWSLAAQVETWGVDGERARNQVGVVGEWMFKWDAFRQLGVYAQVSRLGYPNQSVRDADRRVVGASYAHLFRQGTLAYGGVYAGEESERAAGVAHLGHRLTGLRAGVQQPLSDALAVFTSLNLENRRFGGSDPLFQTVRRDRQSNLNLGLSWVPSRFWRVTPQLSWTQTRSNVVIADYTRTAVSVTARREF